MTSSTEADLTQVIPLLVDGIAQEIGADRRDMRVTFVADHRQQDLSAWKELKNKVMEGTKFVWQRPNDLNHPRAYFEISLDNESLLMAPISTTSECPERHQGQSSLHGTRTASLALAIRFVWKRLVGFEN